VVAIPGGGFPKDDLLPQWRKTFTTGTGRRSSLAWEYSGKKTREEGGEKR